MLAAVTLLMADLDGLRSFDIGHAHGDGCSRPVPVFQNIGSGPLIGWPVVVEMSLAILPKCDEDVAEIVLKESAGPFRNICSNPQFSQFP